MISKHGRFEVFAVLALAVFFFWLGLFILSVACLLVEIAFLIFFRDPEREIVSDDNIVLSPADGTVSEIINVDEAPLLGKGSYLKIGIFLALYNVHVNRSPVKGIIEKVEYRKGQFVTAMRLDSSHVNESNNAVIHMGNDNRILLRQIAGIAARRIIFTKGINDPVEQGERVGIIKFGSRAEIFLPSGCVKDILVSVGNKVAGAATKLILLK